MAWIDAAERALEVLTAAEPERYFRALYVGEGGWVGAWLDVDVDWPALEALLHEGHATAARQRKRRPAR